MIKNIESSKGNQLIGWVTVSSKGQIAIPVELREKLNLKNGDRLLAVLRKDEDGFNLIKSSALNDVFDKFAK
ncbi:MAG: AbrB/MazE/SpoVT family DNA-binding domain-containing protein [bacterium]